MSKLVSENDIKDETWLTLKTDRKITEEPDASWNSASIFTLYKDDHTVANLLRMKLHRNKKVRFAGYKIPHPTVHDVELTVQTAPIHLTGVQHPSTTADGAVAAVANDDPAFVPEPAAAVIEAIDEVLADIAEFTALFEAKVACRCAAIEQRS